MKTKAALAGLGVIALGVALSGCSTAASPSDGETVLRIAWQSGTNTANDEIIAKFEEENPGVTVKLTTAADADHEKTIRTQLLAGTAPDLFMVWPGSANTLSVQPLAAEGLLAPLDGLAWADDAAEGAVEAASYEGTPYMVTPAIDASGAIYNLDTLEELGLSVPTTWSEVLAFCADATSAGRTAFGLGLQEGWTTRLIPYAFVADQVEDVAAFNAALADGSFDFPTSEPWITALERQNEMVDAGCFNASPVGTSMDNAVLPGVLSGEFLGTVSVGAHIGVMLDPKSGDPDAHFTITALPAGDDAAATKLNVLYNNGIAVNAKSKNVELAKKFVELWSSPWALNLTAAEKTLVPSVPNDDYEVPASLADMTAFTDSGRVAGGDWTPGPKTFSALVDGVQGVLLGSTTIDQALTSLQSAYEAGLQ